MFKFVTFRLSKKYPVYNWFYYKEGFSPQLIDWVLKDVNKNIEHIYDPFCGVGTTLLRAKELNIPAIGRDISPLAWTVSYSKTRTYNKNELNYIENWLSNLTYNKPSITINTPFYNIAKLFPPRNLDELLFLRQEIDEINNERIKSFLLTALLSIIPSISFLLKDGGVIKIDKKKRTFRTKDMFKRKVKYMLKTAHTKGIEQKIFMEDSLNKIEPTDIIITSPPYLNNISYAKIYGIELSILSESARVVDIIKGEEIRSFIKRNVENIQEAYFEDMEQSIRAAYESVRYAAYYVVSNSIINNEHIMVDERLKEISKSIGFKTSIIPMLFRRTNIKGHSFNIRESIVKMKK